MSTRVYSYGALAPVTHAQAVSDQIRAANRYRNDLCALERNRREQMNMEMRRIFPEIEKLTKESEAADKAVEKVRAEQRARNARERNRRIAAEAKRNIEALSERRKSLYAQLKAAKLAAYGPDDFKEAQKEYGKVRTRVQAESKKRDVSTAPEVIESQRRMEAAEAQWFANVPRAIEWRAVQQRIEDQIAAKRKELYANFDAHWGTKLTVDAAAQKFRSGPPPQFKRFRGDGSIGVQIQGKMPVRDALDASAGQVGIDGYDPTKKKHKGTVRLRIGTNEATKRPIFAEVPVKFHRPMPEDSQISWAHLHRRRVGTRDRHTVNFTLDRADWGKTDLAERGEVGIDVGWRLVKGGLRVAYWVGDDGRRGELVLPQSLLDRFRYPDERQAERDEDFNRAKPAFHAWLVERWGMLPDWIKRRAAKADKDDLEATPDAPTVIRWKSQARLAALLLHWRQERFEGDADIYTSLEKWRREDEKRFNAESFGRLAASRSRREIYRLFAVTLRRDYARAFIEDANWARMKKNAEAEKEAVPGAVKEYQRIASPGLLHEIISANMRETVKRSAKDTTRIHHGCGEHSGEPNPENLHHSCVSCGEVFDQDENAAENILNPRKPVAAK